MPWLPSFSIFLPKSQCVFPWQIIRLPDWPVGSRSDRWLAGGAMRGHQGRRDGDFESIHRNGNSVFWQPNRLSCSPQGDRGEGRLQKVPPPVSMIVLRVRYFHSQHLLVALPSGATSYSPAKPIAFRSAYFADAL